eukprot:3705357-Lingulodinium_polyedra.AAC.1
MVERHAGLVTRFFADHYLRPPTTKQWRLAIESIDSKLKFNLSAHQEVAARRFWYQCEAEKLH